MTLNELNNKFDIYREILKFDHIVNLSNSIELRNQIVNHINIIIHNHAELLYTIQR